MLNFAQKLLKIVLTFCLFCPILLSATEAKAGSLADRVANFPNWQTQPPVSSAKGDLIYPNWMEGTWQVTSTLVEMVAPLAPDIVTPGFENNRRYLNQPISFLVRFQEVEKNSVKVNEKNPNRQTTILPGNLELVSLVTKRGSEMLNPDEFISTEITQQIFNGESQIYLNEVETTTDYRHISLPEKIEADQITAVYLSPKDPDFFTAAGHPVALYQERARV